MEEIFLFGSVPLEPKPGVSKTDSIRSVVLYRL
jgi:hypothetical protein